MRIAFMGTPEVAVPSLDLLAREHDIALVVTQPDKPAGRGHRLTPPPVKARALELGLSVSQPVRARDESFIEELRTARPEAIAVVAFGQILPQSVLDLPQSFNPQGGCVNLHFSLLPRWRGAAPVQHAILRGDKETGLTTQWMAMKLDAGDVILQERVPIGPNETGGELLARLAQPGAGQLAQALRLMSDGRAPRLPQDETQVTLAPQLRREDGRLNWARSTQELHNQVRALNPWPGAWTMWRGEVFKVWRAVAASEPLNAPQGTVLADAARVRIVTNDGALELLEVQVPGKGRASASDWARGARLQPGETME